MFKYKYLFLNSHVKVVIRLFCYSIVYVVSIFFPMKEYKFGASQLETFEIFIKVQNKSSLTAFFKSAGLYPTENWPYIILIPQGVCKKKAEIL